MEKVRYMISDAANMIQVEQHVLRYWEEELQLEVPRNEMGHRYYTDENINEFLKVKELKEKGYQLKAIRMYLKSDRQRARKEQQKSMQYIYKEEPGENTARRGEPEFLTMTTGRELGLEERDHKAIKMEQFQSVMTEIVRLALQENNEALGNEVGDRILKEMNYLMRENDQLAEERYRKLDAALRGKKVKKPWRLGVKHQEKDNKKGTP